MIYAINVQSSTQTSLYYRLGKNNECWNLKLWIMQVLKPTKTIGFCHFCKAQNTRWFELITSTIFQIFLDLSNVIFNFFKKIGLHLAQATFLVSLVYTRKVCWFLGFGRLRSSIDFCRFDHFVILLVSTCGCDMQYDFKLFEYLSITRS
jgi:hypothetical protein